MGCCQTKYDVNAPVWYPPIKKGKVIKVYDGDTFWIVSKINGQDYKFNIRTFGYDSPELRSKDVEERKAGQEARDYVADKILNKVVKIEVIKKKEKYGRILAKIYFHGKCLNDEMVEKGYGIPYDGGKKKKFKG